MTRAALRDLSNTPQRLNIRQHKADAGNAGKQQHQQGVTAQGQWKGAWPDKPLAEPETVLSDYPLSRDLSFPSAYGRVPRSKDGQPMQHNKDPLSLLAPIEKRPYTADSNNLMQHQQQENEALVREIRRISCASAGLRASPPFSSPSLNGTQSALNSCIRELDDILPHFSEASHGAGLQSRLSDASLVDCTASPMPTTSSLAYSPESAQTALEDLSSAASLARKASSWQVRARPQDGVLNASRAILSPDPVAQASAASASSILSLVPPSIQRARKSDVESICSNSMQCTPLSNSIDSTHQDTDKAVALLGNAMHRLHKSLPIPRTETLNP